MTRFIQPLAKHSYAHLHSQGASIAKTAKTNEAAHRILHEEKWLGARSVCRCGRHTVGVFDGGTTRRRVWICPKTISISTKKPSGDSLNLELQTVYQGDCEAPWTESSIEADYLFDLILTDPPYGDMLSRKRTGERKKRTGDDSANTIHRRWERPWKHEARAVLRSSEIGYSSIIGVPQSQRIRLGLLQGSSTHG